MHGQQNSGNNSEDTEPLIGGINDQPRSESTQSKYPCIVELFNYEKQPWWIRGVGPIGAAKLDSNDLERVIAGLRREQTRKADSLEKTLQNCNAPNLGKLFQELRKKLGDNSPLEIKWGNSNFLGTVIVSYLQHNVSLRDDLIDLAKEYCPLASDKFMKALEDLKKAIEEKEAIDRFENMLEETNALLENIQQQNKERTLIELFDRYWFLNQGLAVGFSIFSEVNKLKKDDDKKFHLESTASRFDNVITIVFMSFCELGMALSSLLCAIERKQGFAAMGYFGAVSIETFTAVFAWNMFDAVRSIILGARQIMRGQNVKGSINLINGMQLSACTSLAFSARFSSVVSNNWGVSNGTAAAPGMVAMHLFSWSFAAAMFMNCALELMEVQEARAREKYALEQVEVLLDKRLIPSVADWQNTLVGTSSETLKNALTLFKEETNPFERARLGSFLIKETKFSDAENEKLFKAHIHTAIREKAQVKKHEASAGAWLACGFAMSVIAIFATATYSFVGPVADMLLVQGISFFSALGCIALAKNGGILHHHAREAEDAIAGKQYNNITKKVELLEELDECAINKKDQEKKEKKAKWNQSLLGKACNTVNKIMDDISLKPTDGRYSSINHRAS